MQSRNLTLLSILALTGSLSIVACGGGDDSSDGPNGDGDTGDGDGDTGDGDGDTGDGDGDTGDGDGDMGGSPGDGDGDTVVVDCTVEAQDDGSALISCPDGTEVVVPPTEVETMTECSAEKDTEGVLTVTCDGEDPIVIDPTPATPSILNRALVKEGSTLVVVEILEDGVRRIPVPLPDTDGTLGFYSLSPDRSAVGYAYGAGLYVVNLSGSAPSDPVRADDGAVMGSSGIAFWQWVGNSGVYFYGDLETVEQFELYYASYDGSGVGDQQKLNTPLIADGDVVIAPETMPSTRDNGIAFVADDQVNDQYELFYADVSGNAPVTTRVNGALSAGEAALYPTLLGPSGQTVAFLHFPDIQGSPTSWNIMVSDVSSGVPGTVRQVNDDLNGDALSSLSFSPDGSTAAYARISAGTSTVMVVDITGALPSTPSPTDLSGVTTLLITAFHSNNNHLIAFGDFETPDQVELYSIDVSGNQPADSIKLNHNLGNAEEVFSAQMSFISERVVYGAGESTPTEYFVVGLDGTGREKIDHGLENGQSLVPVGFAEEADTYLYRVAEGSVDVAAYTVDLTADPVGAELAFSSGGSDITWCGLSADATTTACAANGGIYLGEDSTSAPIAASTSLLFLD